MIHQPGWGNHIPQAPAPRELGFLYFENMPPAVFQHPPRYHSPMEEDHNPQYDLLMPFITVQSNGGPHEDTAYVAGYEMGLLDAQLGGTTFDQGRAIHAEDQPQADLIAMRHGYTAQFTKPQHLCEDHEHDQHQWVCMTVRRTTPI